MSKNILELRFRCAGEEISQHVSCCQICAFWITTITLKRAALARSTRIWSRIAEEPRQSGTSYFPNGEICIVIDMLVEQGHTTYTCTRIYFSGGWGGEEGFYLEVANLCSVN